jgi:hypothetical protein
VYIAFETSFKLRFLGKFHLDFVCPANHLTASPQGESPPQSPRTRPRKKAFLEEATIKPRTKADLSRALVIWGAANNAAALAAPSPTLAVGLGQLAPFCHSNVQRAVLALPGHDVAFVRGRITGAQVLSQRPGYINAILIQREGASRTGDDSCFQCRTNPGRGPLPECRSINGYFGGCCGNCKWRDHAARYMRTFVPVDNDGDSDSGADDNNKDRTRLVKLEANDEGSSWC